ncbi:RNA-binding protein 26 [Trichoplax sp. H2]|nr:RNA-binding protein 26 [Trichoplax sp. H2]|eukprot:RDD41079.1 RNA-binding protein 26 [Trichoplax sp. H2]
MPLVPAWLISTASVSSLGRTSCASSFGKEASQRDVEEQMHIEDFDALKVWLTNRLQPICDADPNALAKYVIALVKKEKPNNEVKNICLNQLEVFLASETTNFVNELFDALKKKAYLSVDDTTTDAPGIDNAPNVDRRISHYETPDDDERDFRRAPRSRNDEDRIEESVEHNNNNEPTGIHVVVSTSNRRSKRRPEDDGRIGQHDRINRGRQRTDRRSDRGKNEMKNLADVGDRVAPGTVNANNRVRFPPKIQQRCRDYDEKGFCVRGETCPYDHGNDAVVVEDTQQLRLPASDMLVVDNGNRPPFRVGPGRMQHHNPPPNMMPIVRPVPPGLRSSMPPPPPMQASRMSMPPPRQPGGPIRGKRLPFSGNDAYNPEQPSFEGRAMMPPPVWPLRTPASEMNSGKPMSDLPRFKPPMSDVNNEMNKKRVAEMDDTGPPQKRRFDYNRLGFKSKARIRDSVTLEIRKIPQELNTITKLNEHFGKFGNIMNIQIGVEGDKQAALIQFSTHAEAKSAHDSPEAVLNNRFIKVFWKIDPIPETEQKPDDDKDSQPSNATELANIGDNSSKPSVVPNKFHNPEAFKMSRSAAATPTAGNSSKDIVQKRLEIQKQSQDLYQKLITQYKILAKKLNDTKNPKERDFILQSLKKLNEDIDSVKNRLVSVPKSRKDAQKELLDKELELLSKQNSGEDTAELEKRVELLKKEATDLGLIESPNKPFHGRIRRKQLRGRWSTRFRGRGRGHAAVSSRSVLDKRTSQLSVQGLSMDDKDDIITHFTQFGNVTGVDVGENDHVIVKFSTRKEAEIAAVKGVIYKTKSLVFSWYNPKPQSEPQKMVTEEKQELDLESALLADDLTEDSNKEPEGSMNVSDNEGLSSSEDSLLLDEEDEADEDRPWRR